MKGKAKCKALKEIRRQIAEKNDIPYVVSQCTYQGDCTGTCPRCESELRYLERELAIRQSLGKAVAVAGISMGVCASLTGCTSPENILDSIFGYEESTAGVAPMPVEELGGDMPTPVDDIDDDMPVDDEATTGGMPIDEIDDDMPINGTDGEKEGIPTKDGEQPDAETLPIQELEPEIAGSVEQIDPADWEGGISIDDPLETDYLTGDIDIDDCRINGNNTDDSNTSNIIITPAKK